LQSVRVAFQVSVPTTETSHPALRARSGDVCSSQETRPGRRPRVHGQSQKREHVGSGVRRREPAHDMAQQPYCDKLYKFLEQIEKLANDLANLTRIREVARAGVEHIHALYVFGVVAGMISKPL
jgi:nitrate/nitrite-specific signal transduction histidine kinase